MAIIWTGSEHVVKRAGEEVQRLGSGDFVRGGENNRDAQTRVANSFRQAAQGRGRPESMHVRMISRSPLEYAINVGSSGSPPRANPQDGTEWYEKLRRTF